MEKKYKHFGITKTVISGNMCIAVWYEKDNGQVCNLLQLQHKMGEKIKSHNPGITIEYLQADKAYGLLAS